jgi:hypothetical protein
VVTEEGRRPLSASLGLATWTEPEARPTCWPRPTRRCSRASARARTSCGTPATSGRGEEGRDRTRGEPAGPSVPAGAR